MAKNRHINKLNYLGRTIIVGLTYFDLEDRHICTKQFHGVIFHVDVKAGINIRNVTSKEVLVLPPRIDAVFPAPPGKYRESSTGKLIINPDYISIWHITKVDGYESCWKWSAIDLGEKSLSSRGPLVVNNGVRKEAGKGSLL